MLPTLFFVHMRRAVRISVLRRGVARMVFEKFQEMVGIAKFQRCTDFLNRPVGIYQKTFRFFNDQIRHQLFQIFAVLFFDQAG